MEVVAELDVTELDSAVDGMLLVSAETRLPALVDCDGTVSGDLESIC